MNENKWNEGRKSWIYGYLKGQVGLGKLLEPIERLQTQSLWSSQIPSISDSMSCLQAPRNHSKWAEVVSVAFSIKTFVDS